MHPVNSVVVRVLQIVNIKYVHIFEDTFSSGPLVSGVTEGPFGQGLRLNSVKKTNNMAKCCLTGGGFRNKMGSIV